MRGRGGAGRHKGEVSTRGGTSGCAQLFTFLRGLCIRCWSPQRGHGFFWWCKSGTIVPLLAGAASALWRALHCLCQQPSLSVTPKPRGLGCCSPLIDSQGQGAPDHRVLPIGGAQHFSRFLPFGGELGVAPHCGPLPCGRWRGRAHTTSETPWGRASGAVARAKWPRACLLCALLVPCALGGRVGG